MGWYETTVDLFRALAWPAVALFLAVWLVRVFRPELAGVLGRLRSVSTPVGTGVFSAQSEAEDVKEGIENLPKPIEESKETLTDEAADRDINGWIELASKYYAAAQYEQTYRLIYGTQLYLLQALNAKPAGAAAEELNLYHQRHLALAQQGFPDYSLSRDDFLRFLVEWGLVTQPSDDRYYLSEWGRGFLAYVVVAGMDYAKPY